MAEDFSFDDLAQDYGLGPSCFEQDQDRSQYGGSYGDVDVGIDVEGYGLDDRQSPGARFSGHDGFAHPSAMHWTQTSIPASSCAAQQSAPPYSDAAGLAHHFDFERAEGHGLVAATVQVAPAVTASDDLSPTPAGIHNPASSLSTRSLGGPTRFNNGIHSSQQQGELVAEPEPGHKIRLVPLSALPAVYRPLFSFASFNAVQSICLPKVLESGDNVVLSAPTGSGKTVIFELALVRMLTEEAENARAVYLAPTKALCSERTRDWSTRFGSVGCGVTELTGDSVHGLHVARKSRLIVTTPEKWDSLTRKWEEQASILSTIRLVLIDEVHILNESRRGARLEVVVTRTKNKGRNVRFIAVSATVPNLEDVAAWIGPYASPNASHPAKKSAEIFQFGDAYRPCPLQKHVYGYPKAKDEFAFQAYLNHKLFELIETHAAGRPCLVFCATRRSTVQAASIIAEACKKAKENGGPGLLFAGDGRRSVEAVSFEDEDLQSLSSSRVAFHHAGLSQKDRRTVEQAFLAEKVAVLCCTTTLATGINLPAYCVIIRGTKQYEGQWCEMSDLDLLQMMGRAGRPQFDRSGVAVIMCEDTVQAHYRELVSGSRDIESSLAPNLVEHVNAEIGLRGRTTEAQIEAWIRQSFMWIRLQKNPTYYLSQEEGIGLDSVEDILKHLCSKTLATLRQASLITCSDQSPEIASTEYGEIMSRFFIRHRSMLALMEIPDGANTRAILEAVSEAEEFGDQRMRQGEKGFLNSLRTHAEIRFPPRQVARVADKVMLLIQANLSAINLMQLSKPAAGEANPYLDMRRIFPHATRIAKAAVDITIFRRDGRACKAALDLARSIAAEAWDGSPAMLRQIDQIGERSIKALANAGITTWQSLANATPHRVEMILNRNPPFGSKVVSAAQSVPRIGLEVLQRSSAPSKVPSSSLATSGANGTPVTSSASADGIKVVLDVTIRIENRSTCMLKSKNSKMALSICILTLTSDGDYIDFRRMPIWRFDPEKRFTLHVHLENPRMRILTYAACDEIAGTMMQATLIPVDMANGSHRTRVARAVLHRGDPSDFGADSTTEASTGPSRINAHDNFAVHRSSDALHDDPELEDELGFKRCKHKCKGECRHVCCQRAREQESLGRPAEYRFQSRPLDDRPQNTMSRYLRPASTLTSTPALVAQKRKADLDLEVADLEDDLDGPQDLLSRLDRLDAETDRLAGIPRPLQMPPRPRAPIHDAYEGGLKDGDLPSLESFQDRSPACSGMESGTEISRPHFGPVPAPPTSDEHAAEPASPALQRPAQHRFLKLVGRPSWLGSSDTTGC